MITTYTLTVPVQDPSTFANNKAVEDTTTTPITFDYQTFPGDQIKELEGGWQVLKKPRHIIPNDTSERGNYLVELNSNIQDLANLNDPALLNRFKEELYFLAFQPGPKRIILSFYNCKDLHKLSPQRVLQNNLNRTHNSDPLYLNTTISGTTYIAEFIKELGDLMTDRGQQLSVIHNEPMLHPKLTSLGFQETHENLFDAIRNGREIPSAKKSPFNPLSCTHYS